MQNSNTRLKIALLSVYLVIASLNAITANIPEIAKTFSTVPLYVIELIATVPSLFQMRAYRVANRLPRASATRTASCWDCCCAARA